MAFHTPKAGSAGASTRGCFGRAGMCACVCVCVCVCVCAMALRVRVGAGGTSMVAQTSRLVISIYPRQSVETGHQKNALLLLLLLLLLFACSSLPRVC